MFVRHLVGEEAEEECPTIVHRTPNGQNEGAAPPPQPQLFTFLPRESANSQVCKFMKLQVREHGRGRIGLVENIAEEP
jgi:hypothetical protein